MQQKQLGVLEWLVLTPWMTMEAYSKFDQHIPVRNI
jgi:hypothetical protein